MSVWTKRGYDIFSPTDAAGLLRSVLNGDVQVWATEVERLFKAGSFNSVDAVGLYADRSTYDGEAEGFVYLSIDGDGAGSSSTVAFIKESAASGDWSPPVPFQGDKGWSPLFRVVNDGARRLLEVFDWIGGDGEKPALTGYIGAAGLTANIAEAVDIRGPQGVSGSGLLWSFEAGTADEDPGAGKLRANAADLSAATELFVSKVSAGGDPVASFLAGLTNSTSTHKGYLILTEPSSGAQATYDVTGTTDAAGYVKISVSGHSGSAALTNAALLSVVFSRTGNAGDLNGVNPGAAGLAVLGAGTEAEVREAIGIDALGITPYMFGAVGDGVADDLTPLNDMLAYAAANGVPAIISAGTFACIAGSPVVPSNVTVFGIAGGTIVQKTLPNTNPLSGFDPGDGEFSGLHIDRTSRDITIDGVRIRGPYGDINDGVGVGRIVVSDGGSGYSVAPTVEITSADGNGAGATAVANLDGGAVKDVTVTDPGSGYTARPIISLTGGDGSGAVAYATTVETRYRSIGIAVSGRYDQYFYENPNYPGNPSDPLDAPCRNIFIRNCDIEGFAQSGILADQIVNFEAINNRIHRCGRDGIRMYGVLNPRVFGNDIDEMAPGFLGEGAYPNNNVYGVSATRIYHSTAGDGSLTDYPPSRDGVVIGNTISNCWSWKAMDTHGGVNVGYYNNVCRDSHIGLGIDKGGYSAADGYAPPVDIKEDGNTFEITSAMPLTGRAGIFLTAHDATDNNIGKNNVIGSSTFIGYGQPSTGSSIYIGYQSNPIVHHPSIRQGVRCGILCRDTIVGMRIAGLTVHEMEDASGVCNALRVESADVEGVVGPIIVQQDGLDVLTAVSLVSPNAGYGVKLSSDNVINGNATFAASPANTAPSEFLLAAQAWGNVNNGGSAALSAGVGIVSVSRTGTGVVRVTFNKEFSTAGTAAVFATPKGGGSNQATVNAVSSTAFDVYTRDTTGAAVDVGFYITAFGY